MCLYPRFIKNKRYESYKVKKGDVPLTDYRKKYVAIGCGRCMECLRQKAQQWRVRLCEELKVHKHAYFVTLTFSNESLIKIASSIDSKEVETNAVATEAVRRFVERYRKHNKKSIRHWLITELGHENTERIHLHGIIFDEEEWDNEKLLKYWQYGRVDTGQYCNLRTINYIIKYVTKIDTEHKNYQPIILCSAGIGENFVHTLGAKNTYKYRPKESAEYYTLNNGQKVALPIYYRNKLYSVKERDMLWTDRLDKHEIYVNGIKVRNTHTKEGENNYFALLKSQQKINHELGYGSTDDEWKKIPYNITWKMLQKASR